MNIFPKSACAIFYRHFSSPPKLTKIPSRYRERAIIEAQQAVTEYLHSTKSVPFAYAEHIGKNSICTLSNLISNVEFKFSSPSFKRTIQKFLRYHPINEFEFFFESIGIGYNEVDGYLPTNKFFFSEDETLLNAAYALSGFGFPWTELGKLYKQVPCVFKNPKDIQSKLYWFKNHYEFNNVCLIGVCLAFPSVLGSGDGENAALLDDLKRLFVDFDLISSFNGNAESWYEICRKIRLFYNLGFKKGEFGELLGRNKELLLDYSEEVLIQKVEYFSRFGVGKEEVGSFLLQNPEILSFDLESRTISVEGLLKYIGLRTYDLKILAWKYPYVFGRNKMANLPNVIRALNLQEWFFNKINNGDHQKLRNYALSDPDEDLDKEFRDNLESIQSSKLRVHISSKLEFLHYIGFGENSLTVKTLTHLHGTSNELQDRFSCLLRSGIEFSKLCKMISMTPKALNQKPTILEQKLNFIFGEMGITFDFLNTFPAVLCFDLEYRIKPRYRFHMWLIEKGLSTRNYSIASMIATSEKSFIARVYSIHPAAPKHWFECFSCKRTQN